MASWPLFRLVSQQSLKSVRLEFDDRPVERASLFPLFDDEGRTRMLMITAEENARIMMADWAPGVFARDWARRSRVRLRFADLSDASMVDEERFADLWHADPWWVLNEERYQGHGAVPTLQRTNIPGYDPKISGMVFNRGLERAAYVVFGSDQSAHLRRFTADTLTAFAGRRRAAHDRPRPANVVGWRLRPSWRYR